MCHLASPILCVTPTWGAHVDFVFGAKPGFDRSKHLCNLVDHNLVACTQNAHDGFVTPIASKLDLHQDGFSHIFATNMSLSGSLHERVIKTM
jgi:hypothetical protein